MTKKNNRRKAKHRKDYNHGKNGMVGGNPRYSQQRGRIEHALEDRTRLFPMRRLWL